MAIEDFEWSRCPEGYRFKNPKGEIVDDVDVNFHGDLTIEPATTNEEIIKPFAKDGSLVVRQFVQISDETPKRNKLAVELARGFISTHGLPPHPREPYALAELWTTSMTLGVLLEFQRQAWLKNTSQRRRNRINRETVEFYNDAKNAWGAVESRLEYVKNEPPKWVVMPKNLFHGLWVQFAEMLQTDAGHLRCDWCGEWYLPKRRPKANAKNNFCTAKHKTAFANDKSRKERLKKEKK
ncbi:hypothetical protein OAJ57_03690 [Alphaproteobacteria bacterium]|nr:hypothetical protein [Alphaproteobacteria bacterium]